MKKRITIVFDDEEFTRKEAVVRLFSIVQNTKGNEKDYYYIEFVDGSKAIKHPAKNEIWSVWKDKNEE